MKKILNLSIFLLLIFTIFSSGCAGLFPFPSFKCEDVRVTDVWIMRHPLDILPNAIFNDGSNYAIYKIIITNNSEKEIKIKPIVKVIDGKNIFIREVDANMSPVSEYYAKSIEGSEKTVYAKDYTDWYMELKALDANSGDYNIKITVKVVPNTLCTEISENIIRISDKKN